MAVAEQTERNHSAEMREIILERIRVIEEQELPRLRAAERALRDPSRRGRPPKIRG